MSLFLSTVIQKVRKGGRESEAGVREGRDREREEVDGAHFRLVLVGHKSPHPFFSGSRRGGPSSPFSIDIDGL